MRKDEVERLVDSLEYGRAKHRLTRTEDPTVRKRYEEIIRNYERKYSIKSTILLKGLRER